MKNSICLILLLFISCFSKQVTSNHDNLDFIKVDISELYKNNKDIKIKLSIKIPIDKLVFNKRMNGFESKLSINAIFIKDDDVIVNESWDINIDKYFFEDTRNNDNVTIVKELFIPDGQYTLNLIINDYENHISWIKNKKFELYDDFVLSDIFLFKKYDQQYVSISENDIIDLDTLWLQFYLETSNKPVKITYKFSDFDKNRNDAELIYEDVKEDKIGLNDVYYPILLPDVFFNIVDISIEYMDVTRTKSIVLDRYKDKIYDYSILIGPMTYILENSDFRKYREYQNLIYNNKIEYIKKYWNTNDRNSVTDLFVEFYNRVEYCNANFYFLSYEGWESDMGKIYIIYGKPYNIKNEYTVEAEYEIWTYKNNKQFIFINKYGNYVLSTYD